ncbi:inositol monophosphatase family protein [Marinomonas pollencensis]|uniref:Inositol-1-monophosphatase n=1 Tax=Marinomonas pollencensis TaxID=491954 RepID=A0A3E0DFH8_9GAMM|nr:inositol monophosphatase family protein [Marinomonas pollencensis]REG81442.1 myo-inositol-1(or 4)-monophosphatase [Marinomonas pollencensis]
MTLKCEELLAFALRIAEQAATMMQQARETKAFSADYKADHELVTSTDLAIDRYLCGEISAAYPSHCILSEESSPNLLLGEAPTWVIDPIDGTVNYAHQHRHVAVSIALYVDGQRFLGVVHAPFLEECYWAVKGQGAYLNGARLKLTDTVSLRNALVATGFPYQKNALEPLIKRVSNVLHQCQDIRRNGSAALDLCWLAAGRLQAYYESVKPWDMAAGALIACEAGAVLGRYDDVTSDWPLEINGDALLVCVPSLYEPMQQVLALD